MPKHPKNASFYPTDYFPTHYFRHIMPENPNASDYFSMLKGPKNSENLLHKHVCQYIAAQYPGFLFRSGLEGFHLSTTDAQFATIINSHRGFPDLMVFKRRGQYVGLALELKKDDAPLFKKDGSLCKSEHLQEQQEMLVLLRAEGWYAHFAQGFNEAKKLIDHYMSL